MRNQESYIINGRATTKYFKLEKGTRQGDPNSVYLLIAVPEIAFLYIKQNKSIEGLIIFTNFLKHVWKIEKVLKLWRMRNLTVEWKIAIFKTVAISKIIHLCLVNNVLVGMVNKTKQNRKIIY